MSLRSALAAFLLIGCAATPDGGADRGTATLRLGGEARLAGAHVRLLRVVEDSRCPAGVQCIHAGTVRIALALRDGGAARETVLGLDDPREAGGGLWLGLVAVCPPQRPPGAAPSRDDRYVIAYSRGSPLPAIDFACPAR
jgi:hypothetical protein